MTKDGGPENPPAFPFCDGSRPLDPGMSLRDYFAAMALQGMLAGETGELPEMITIEGYARDAYRHADALLAERAKEGR